MHTSSSETTRASKPPSRKRPPQLSAAVPESLRAVKISRTILKRKLDEVNNFLKLSDLQWDNSNEGWPASSRSSKSMAKRRLANFLHRESGGSTSKAASLILSILRDKSFDDIASSSSSREEDSMPTNEFCALLNFARNSSDYVFHTKLIQNLSQVMEKLSSDRMNLDKDGKIARNIIVASIASEEVRSNPKLASKFRKFARFKRRFKFDKLVEDRSKWMSGGSNNIVERVPTGRKKWASSSLNSEIVATLHEWLLDDANSRPVPGKYNMRYKHFDSLGNEIMYHSSKNSSNSDRNCNALCQCEPLRWKIDTDINLHQKFIKAHPQFKLSRQRFSKILPFWLERKPREICVCTYHKQASLILEAHNAIMSQLHGDDCHCTCAFCESGDCGSRCSGFDDLSSIMNCHDGSDIGVDSLETSTPLCALSKCSECPGFDKCCFMKCPLERSEAKLQVSWKEVVKSIENVPTSSGVKEKKNINVKTRRGTLAEFRIIMKDTLYTAGKKFEGWHQEEGFFQHRLLVWKLNVLCIHSIM